MTNITNKTGFFLESYTQIGENLARNIMARIGGEDALIEQCYQIAAEGIDMVVPSFQWGGDMVRFYETNKTQIMSFLETEAAIIGYPSKDELVFQLKRMDGQVDMRRLREAMIDSNAPDYNQVASAITYYVSESLCIDYSNFSHVDQDGDFGGFLTSYTDMNRSLIINVTDQLGGHRQLKRIYADVISNGLMGHMGFIAFRDILSLYDNNKAEILDYLNAEAHEFRFSGASTFVESIFSGRYTTEVIDDALNNADSEYRKEILCKVVFLVVETICSEFSNFLEIYREEAEV